MDLLRIAARVAAQDDQGDQDDPPYVAPKYDDPGVIEPVAVDVREYEPVGGDSPYATIDGRFSFRLPNGRVCEFDGRLDPMNVTGRLTCDGEDVSDQLFSDENLVLDFLDPDLDALMVPLPAVLESLIERAHPGHGKAG